MSSGVGSFQRILQPGTVEHAVTLPVYPATKAALTMLTVQYARALDGILVSYEPHVQFKTRIPAAIGLIRTGDTVQYANMILVSG